MSDEPERGEAQIEEVLAGRGGAATDPTVLWLAATARPSAPPALLARIEAQVAAGREVGVHAATGPDSSSASSRRRSRRAFVVQGVGGLVPGSGSPTTWVSPTPRTRSGRAALALIAVGVCAAAAAVSRRWSAVSVLTCTPLAIGFGLHGITEVGVFAAGVALHFTEGLCGILLAVAWWWDRRDTSRALHEDRP